MLDLAHLALALDVTIVEALRDDAVAAGGLELLEPALRGRPIGRRGREVPRGIKRRGERHQPLAALVVAPRAQVLACGGQQVEGDEGRRRLRGELRDAGLGRMDALRERVEVEHAVGDDDHLAIDDAAGWQRL